MSRRSTFILSTTLLLLASFGWAAEQTAPVYSHARGACAGGDEKWVLGKSIRPDFAREFDAYVNRKTEPVEGFSEGLALRKQAMTNEAKMLGEFWIAHALSDAKLQHIAFQGFASIVSQNITPKTVGVQVAALECMARIHYRYPSLVLPEKVAEQLAVLTKQNTDPYGRDVIWNAVGIRARTLLSQEHVSTSEVERTLALLQGAGPHEDLAQALWASKRNDFKKARQSLEAFFKAPAIPTYLKRFRDDARLLLARADFSVGDFDAASDQFKMVNKSSNQLAESLSELSWAYLMAEKYPEAIGTAMSLQAGGLRHTFAPEAPMVMAMALNEICQYPESVKAIAQFKKYYEDSYDWLKTAPQDVYPLAIQFIKKTGKYPERVATEWLRSPVFISNQTEINLLFEERDASISLSKSGAHTQHKLAMDIAKAVTELLPKLRQAKTKQKPGDPLPKKIVNSLVALKRQITHFGRFQQAAPTWRLILANYQGQVKPTEKRLIAQINQDLSTRNRRMHKQLEEFAENIQLIEVEIYNGASQDIIWQNAHPDYKEMAGKFKDEKSTPDKVWDWGRNPASANEEQSEIWEDELGSFKANLYDNCSSKDKYLALRVRGR